MAIPEFITRLRAKIGHEFLWLSGVTAVVRRRIDGVEHVLLIQRSDNGAWTPVTGVLDPCEEPAVAAEREVLEESGIQCRVVRLASVKAGEPMMHANGDRAAYLDLCFECEWVSGDPVPDNEETIGARWCPLDDLPDMSEEMTRRIRVATAGGETRLYRRES